MIMKMSPTTQVARFSGSCRAELLQGGKRSFYWGAEPPDGFGMFHPISSFIGFWPIFIGYKMMKYGCWMSLFLNGQLCLIGQLYLENCFVNYTELWWQVRRARPFFFKFFFHYFFLILNCTGLWLQVGGARPF